jgi:hypothetical protein
VPLLITAMLASGVGIIGGQNGSHALSSDYYPTAIRATGVGWALGIGRIVSNRWPADRRLSPHAGGRCAAGAVDGVLFPRSLPPRGSRDCASSTSVELQSPNPRSVKHRSPARRFGHDQLLPPRQEEAMAFWLIVLRYRSWSRSPQSSTHAVQPRQTLAPHELKNSDAPPPIIWATPDLPSRRSISSPLKSGDSAQDLAGHLDQPWSIAFLPDGALLLTERIGTIRMFRNGRLSDPIAGVPAVQTGGPRGCRD